MKHKKFDFRTAYIDLLLNVLTGIIFLFAITTLLIQAPTKSQDEGLKRNAEYIISATWDPDIDCDIDMWVEDPLGNVVSFRTLSAGVMSIERDDMGFKGDYLYDMNGNILTKASENKEIWTLRGKLTGKFTLNLHLYSCRVDNVPLQLGEEFEVPVKIELVKLNPTYSVIRKELFIMSKIWQEATVFNFDVPEAGMPIFTKEFKKLVKDKKTQ